MNKQTQEALKMAIEALEKLKFEIIYSDEEIEGKNQVSICERQRQLDHNRAINACKEALENPAQEPVAWVTEDVLDKQFVEGRPRRVWYECNKGVGFKIYIHPAQALKEKNT